MFPITSVRAPRWTTKPRFAAPRSISPGSWCRCCRKPFQRHLFAQPRSTACASSATCRSALMAWSVESRFYEAVMHSPCALDLYRGLESHRRERSEMMARPSAALMPRIDRLHQLYEILSKARAKRGAIEFESSEVRFSSTPGRGYPGRHAGAQRCAQADRGMHDRGQCRGRQGCHPEASRSMRRSACMTGRRSRSTPTCWST